MVPNQVNMGALSQRVEGLEVNLSQLRADQNRMETTLTGAIQDLSRKFDDRSKTPWGVLISAATFVLFIACGYIHLALQPYDKDIAAIVSNEEKLNVKLDKDMVPRSEHEQEWKTNDEKFSNLESRLRSDVTSMSQRIDGNATKIDNIVKDFGSTYSIKDAIQTVNDRLSKLETETNQNSKAINPSK